MTQPILVTGVRAAGDAGDGPVESHGARSYSRMASAVKQPWRHKLSCHSSAYCFSFGLCHHSRQRRSLMRRRDIIGLFGSFPLGNLAGLWRQPVLPTSSSSTDHVTGSVAAIADVMFPGDGLPGAAALGVHNSVLEMSELRASIIEGVAWLDKWAMSQAQANFIALDEAGRLAAIDAAFASRSAGVQQFVLAMRFHLGTAYYSQPSVKAAFAYTGPPQPE